METIILDYGEVLEGHSHVDRWLRLQRINPQLGKQADLKVTEVQTTDGRYLVIAREDPEKTHRDLVEDVVNNTASFEPVLYFTADYRGGAFIQFRDGEPRIWGRSTTFENGMTDEGAEAVLAYVRARMESS